MMDIAKSRQAAAEAALVEKMATRIAHAEAGQAEDLAWDLARDLLSDFKAAGGALLPVAPNGTVWVIHRRRAVSATVMFVGAGADGLTSFSVLRGRPGTTAWSSMQFTEQQIGQVVFLTREDALAALEGLK